MSTGKRLVAGLALCALLLSFTAQAGSRRYRVTNGGLYTGLDWFTPLQGDRFRDTLYPTFGFLLDQEKFHIDGNTVFPYIFTDALIAAIRFLGGTDSGLPLMDSLNNSDPNPGRFRMLAFTFRYALLNEGPHKIDLGLSYDIAWMSGRFEPAVTPEEAAAIPGGRHEVKTNGLILNNLAVVTAYGFRSRHFSTNVGMATGVGMGSMSLWNPFVGLEAMNRIRFGKHMGMYLRLVGRLQRMDYSGYEFKSSIDPKLYDYNFNEWIPMLSVEVGFMVSIMKTKF